MKRMTRKQVTGLLLPIRSALKEMLSGEVDAIRGYAVTALAFLKSLETPLIKQDWHHIKSCLTTEMIAIELQDLKEAA